ncbi:MAG: HAMP domain-containing histidine kinase [Defluviitaleaceae bacterium]|nr:HAMP domain-containing histidine kinase [Defluviitaleaceae bacterium]
MANLDKTTENIQIVTPLKPSRVLNIILGGFHSLRFKLFLSYILVSVLPLFVLWGIISATVEEHLLGQRVGEIRAGTSQQAVFLSLNNFMHDVLVRPMHHSSINAQASALAARIYIVDPMGIIIYDSQGMTAGISWAHQNIMDALDGQHSYSVVEDGGNFIIQSAMPIVDANGVVGAVMLEHTMMDAGAIISSINTQTLWIIAGIGAAVAAVVLFIAGWFLGPIKHVLSAVKSISEGHLNKRVKLGGKDEMSVLGAAVNDMAQKLERVETARQEFVSNVSHELKTPLASVKVLSESLLHEENAGVEVYREFLADINSEVDRMTDIINELLTLVRLDEVELPLNISNFSLNKMLEGIIWRLKPLADAGSIEIEFNHPQMVSIYGDEMKLSLAISNLVENAVKYSNEGGQVKIMLQVDARNVFVTVADSGVGISEEDHARVFTRFFRADKGRHRETGGTGLGLAITHKTILLHNGSINLSSKLGEGSVFTARIPLKHKSQKEGGAEHVK